MKKLLMYFAVFAMSWLSGTAAAEDYLMPQWGYEEKTIATGESLTFYDFKGEADIPSASSSNSYSTIVFKPAEAGYGVNIAFDYIEVEDDGSGWVSYLDIFDGVFDKTLVNGGSYPSSVSGSTTPFSQLSTPLKHYENGKFSNETFQSSDGTGALSVCFHYRYAGASRGWKATVTTVKLQDMELKSATAVYDFVNSEIWAGKQDVALAGLNIVAEGGGNPDAVQTITFTLTGTDVIDVSKLAVYAGKAANVSELTNTEAVITENEGVYTATLNKTLGNGNNYFTIGGAILSSAAFNATASVNVTGIATAGGFTAFTPAAAVTLTVQPMYLMATDATYSIAQDTKFYDEGGKDGNVVKGFDGKVVFAPATDGKKVQLTFKEIDVFYTDYAANSTGYVDYIKVYNGNSTDEKDLLWQLTQAEASSKSDIAIKSTAADGKLTITHKNNVSYDSNLKAGWEAVVSEFMPQAMTVSGVEATKQTGTTVSAGAEDVLIASLKVTTVETEPALAVKELLFNTNNTNTQLAKAKLYYTKSNSFATSNLLGEVAIADNKVTLAAANSVSFREGENYLWLVYDIHTLAENGMAVDVVLEKLLFTNGTEYASFAAADGQLTIKNEAVQACGSQVFNIQGEWQYTHTVANEYSTKYKAEDCDQTVVFKPIHEGYVIQIDYADFDAYYSSNSYYGTRAKYIVYAGEGTSGDKLWELDANGKKPTQIRSTAADGAITIVFNPNTTSTYYNGEGWHATVKEYKLQNMQLESVSVSQASSKLVQLEEQKAALLDINLQTLGTLNPLTVDALTVDMKGTENNVETIYLLQGENVLAQAAAAAQVTLTLETPATLAEYDNAFVVVADIKADATVETAVDAALKSVTLSGNAQAIADGDPEGSRTVKNVRYLQAGDNGTVTIGENSLMFYDDGGADGNYTKNMEGYITFVPANEGYAVEVEVKNYKISNGAPLKIYYGRSHEGDADATVEYNYSNPEKFVGDVYISSAEDGALTIYFKDQSYGNANEGWEFEVRQHLLTNLTITEVEATSVAADMQTVGAKDLQMLRVAVTVTGDRTPITIDRLAVEANAFAQNIRYYATGTIATFSNQNELTAAYIVNERGTYYFWVVADASAEADDNDVMSVQLTAVYSGQTAFTPAQTIVAQTKLAHGMKGTYYIGNDALADFHTITNAVDAMDVLGVEGDVAFMIASGTYNEQVVLSEIAGTSADATITFCAESGNAADVVFSNDNTSDTEGVWTINGMDYLTLKNITFKSNKEGYASCLVLKNMSMHVTIDSCVLTTDQTNFGTSQNMQLVRVISEDADNANCNYLTIRHSTFIGGYHALNLTQGSYATHPYRTDYVISGNTFIGQEKLVIYTNFLNNLTVTDNSIAITNAGNTDVRALDIRALSGHYVIAGNTITLQCTGSGYANAIYFATSGQTNCAEGTKVDVYNNAIYVESSANSAGSCLRFKWQREVNMSYNTLLINGTYSTTSALWLENFSNLQLTATNNLIQNINTGNAIFGVKGTYSHNALYSESGNINNSNAAFADWQTAVGATDEDANLNEKAVFASNTLLLLRQAGGLVSATPVAGITTDITGKLRAAVPTIGAYEYDADLFRVPALAEGYPAVLNVKDSLADIVVKADNIGTARVLVLAADAEAPGVETVIAQGAELTLQKDAEASITIKGLNEETAYKAYVVTLSPLGDAAAAVTATESFTTLWTLRPVMLNTIAEQTVAAGTALSLTATLTTEYEQAKPYTYSWRTAFSNDEIGNDATLNINATRATEYICHVTDKFGQDAYVSAHVWVETADAATFEEYTLPESRHKMVDDAWADGEETYLYSGSYAFANVPNKSYNAFSGYVISADKSNEATGEYMIDQFRSAAGGAYEGDNFAIAYYSAPSSWYAGYKAPITLTYTTEAKPITGFYVTNSAYTLDAILNGDYANDAFGEGDYLSLTVKGYNGETLTGEVMFYLADYRSANESERFALKEWKWLDLSRLGAVTRLEFEMFTTKSDQFGFTTPTYFCLDNFGVATHDPATGAENINGSQKAVKCIRDGILYLITSDGKQFNTQGALVK